VAGGWYTGDMKDLHLVSIRAYGLLGSSFYWNRYADYNLTKEELIEAGMIDDQIYVDEAIIPALLEVDKELQKRGWRLYIKEGYRSSEIYNLVYRKRVEKYGQEMTDRLLNIKTIPHSTGRAVDVAIWDEKTNSEIYLRKLNDGPESLLMGFYDESVDEEGRRCGELQKYLVDLMASHGFKLGSRGEYFHFELV